MEEVRPIGGTRMGELSATYRRRSRIRPHGCHWVAPLWRVPCEGRPPWMWPAAPAIVRWWVRRRHFPMLLDIGAAATAIGLWKRRCRRRVKRWRGRRCASGGEADDVGARWVEELSWGPDKGGGKRDRPACLGSCRCTSLV